MKVIFLDIDGVLNHNGCKELFNGMYGVEDDRLDLLSKIVDETHAAIVLASSWKELWNQMPMNSNSLDPMALYLVNKLKSRGLHLTDRTTDPRRHQRGHGIKAWLRKVPEIESWVVLDDEVFPDYEECGIGKHLIRTDSERGLTEKDAEKAIEILNGK